jgi:tryptophan halogenase
MDINDKEEYFDYIIDCRGFPKDFSEYKICDIPVNHCLVHNKKEPGDWCYTGHRATKNGWMFEIPLRTRQSYGYLFNNNITSKEQALEDFSKEIDVPVSDLDDIQYIFKSYYCKKAFDGRVLKNGNSVTFFEPMFANSLWIYNNVIRYFVSYLHNDAITVDDVNNEISMLGDQVEHMIYYFYHGGSTYDTEFWNQTKTHACNKLYSNNNLERCINQFQNYKNEGYNNCPPTTSWVFNGTALDIIDREFGYNYFKG